MYCFTTGYFFRISCFLYGNGNQFMRKENYWFDVFVTCLSLSPASMRFFVVCPVKLWHALNFLKPLLFKGWDFAHVVAFAFLFRGEPAHCRCWYTAAFPHCSLRCKVSCNENRWLLSFVSLLFWVSWNITFIRRIWFLEVLFLITGLGKTQWTSIHKNRETSKTKYVLWSHDLWDYDLRDILVTI